MNILLSNSFGKSEVNVVEIITETKWRRSFNRRWGECFFFLSIFTSVINGNWRKVTTLQLTMFFKHIVRLYWVIWHSHGPTKSFESPPRNYTSSILIKFCFKMLNSWTAEQLDFINNLVLSFSLLKDSRLGVKQGLGIKLGLGIKCALRNACKNSSRKIY